MIPAAGYVSADVLGSEAGSDASEFFASIDDTAGDGPSWCLIKVPGPKSTKKRTDVDLSADDRHAEVEGLVGIGATRISENDEWGASWTLLTDPEGNEFCVGAEHS